MYSAGDSVYAQLPARFSCKEIGRKEVFDAPIDDAAADFDAVLHQNERRKGM